MELNGFFPIIRRWLAVIIAATVMATVVGMLLAASADKTYEARAEMLVGPLSTDTDTMRASGDLAQTYAQLAISTSVLSKAAEELDLPTGELKSGVRATANGTTRFLVVRARSHNAQDAADIANAITLQLIELGKQDPTRPEGQLRVIDPAKAPSSPTSPRLDLIVPLAALAGLLGSVSLVLLFEFVGDTAESSEKVDVLTGVPTLTVSSRQARTATGTSEAYRIIATQIDLAAPTVSCVLITGVTDDDGTDDVARHLADVWWLRRPAVTVLDARTGELTVIAQPLGEADGPQRRMGTVDVRTSRPEAITIEEAGVLRSQAGECGGLLVVIGAPATTSAGTLVWARVADVTILSVRRFQARRSAISDAVVNLNAVEANLALSVLHERPRAKHRARGAAPRAVSAPEPRHSSDWGGSTRSSAVPASIRAADPLEDLASVAVASPPLANGSQPTDDDRSRSRSGTQR